MDLDHMLVAPTWPTIPLEVRAPHSLGLTLGFEFSLMPSLDTHLYSLATGEVSQFI